MNETGAGPRAGLFPEGPILDVPFAIAMAASALRRFTATELAACAGRAEAEAAAWIEANPDILQPVEGGVPWALRAADPFELHVRLHGDWRQGVDRIEALDHAEFYAGAAESGGDGVDRTECLSWARDWLRVAAGHLEGHRAIRNEVAPGLAERVQALRERLDAPPP